MIEIKPHIQVNDNVSCTNTVIWLLKWYTAYGKMKSNPKIPPKRPKRGQDG